MSTFRSLIESLYDERISVVVGPEKKIYRVHKGLLCECSKFFKAAFNGSFSEAARGVIEIPEEDVLTFDIIYTWLYINKLIRIGKGENVACDGYNFALLWIFGDKFDMPRLCNEAIDGILHGYQDEGYILHGCDVRIIYSMTAENSLLRKALVATYIGFGNTTIGSLLEEYEDDLLECPELLYDLAKASAATYIDFGNTMIVFFP